MEKELEGLGYLVVQVTTAGSAIPLEGALVSISKGGRVMLELRTANDGRTERVALSAPLRAEAQRPGGAPAFSNYEIRVSVAGYEDNEYQNVPIFDGVTSYQQAVMIPVPENGYGDDFNLNGANLFNQRETTL